MDRGELLKQLNEVFIDTFDDTEIQINDTTVASDIANWDSLNHIPLIVAIERHFKIRFTAREIQTFNNVGEMLDCIQSKRA